MKKESSSIVCACGIWTFVIGSEFEVLNNGDSVQAVHGTRVVYVSSLHIGSAEKPARADQIRATAAKSLTSNERLSHIGQSFLGDAEIVADGEAWRLQGTMCADGTVATCTIDFQSPEDRDWAIAVWKSLHCEGKPA